MAKRIDALLINLARLAYRFHPLYNCEIQVIRNRRTRDEPGVIVQSEDDLMTLY